MDLQEIEIKKITAQEPNVNKRQSFRFITIPLRTGDDKKIILLLRDQRLKIFGSDYTGEKTYSVGITLTEPILEIMKDLEKLFQKLAMKKKPEVKKLGPSFSNFREEDFKLIKIDKSEKEKIYGKLYLTKGKINSPFYQLVEKNGRKKKKEVNHHELIGVPLEGSIVIEINQIFCGNIKSLTCVVKETLIKEIVKPQSIFDDYEDEDEDEDEERRS